MRPASASTAASSSAAGTTRLTRPHSSAVDASIISPVNSISSARLRPTARSTGTIGVEQNSPMLTPGVANRASSDATARSQAATSWQPGRGRDAVHPRDDGLRDLVQPGHDPHARREQLLVEAGVAVVRSSPRGRDRRRTPGPAPSITTTRTSGSAATRSRASSISCMIASESALRRSGRFRVSRATAARLHLDVM